MTILDEIIARRKEAVATQKKSVPFEQLQRVDSEIRPFFKKDGQVTLIAECKMRSPSKGVMVAEYDPPAIAQQYYAGGADAISVLTEPEYFGGADAHLQAVRGALPLPVLRKDFIVDRYQVRESWALGADAILLIAAALPALELKMLAEYAFELGLEVLLEVHSLDELQAVAAVPSTAVGVNARDLKSFTIDLDLPARLRAAIPEGRVAVAESGLHSAADGVGMYHAGFRSFLVGEYFVKAADRTQCVKEFKQALIEQEG